jgi:hypothetical protein
LLDARAPVAVVGTISVGHALLARVGVLVAVRRSAAARVGRILTEAAAAILDAVTIVPVVALAARLALIARVAAFIAIGRSPAAWIRVVLAVEVSVAVFAAVTIVSVAAVAVVQA